MYFKLILITISVFVFKQFLWVSLRALLFKGVAICFKKIASQKALAKTLVLFIFFFLLRFLSLAYAQNSTSNMVKESSLSDESTIEVPQQRPGATIEANVVNIILNDEHHDGVDWGAIVSDFHTVALKKEENPVWTDKKYRLSFGTVSIEDYAVLLEALDTVGRMSQFPQSPIEVSLDVKTGSVFEGQGIRFDFRLSKLKPSGLSLSIESFVPAMISEFRQGRKLPVALQLKAQTDMKFDNNATIVIGGLVKEEEITKMHKFPLLGDIPLLGLVFRNQGRLIQKTETVIFLTVHAHAVD